MELFLSQSSASQEVCIFSHAVAEHISSVCMVVAGSCLGLSKAQRFVEMPCVSANICCIVYNSVVSKESFGRGLGI